MQVVEEKEVEEEKEIDPPESPLPTLEPRCDTNKEYNFEEEKVWLPFPFNLDDALFTKQQQDWLINMVYDNQQVFFLHNEDMGYCDILVHTILTTTDKSVYLPRQMAAHQLQGKAHKCLDTWLRQDFIQTSKSPYASQLVTAHMQTVEI